MSNKQFWSMFVVLIFVMIYPMYPLNLVETKGKMLAFIWLVIPYVLLFFYLTFKLEKKNE